MNNIDFLNGVRALASTEYKTRIPQATQTNVTGILDLIKEYTQTKDEFTGILLNKIVKTMVVNKAYTNPLKVFKKEPIPFGKTIESVFVELIQAKNFSEKFGDGTSEASSLLAKETINIKPEYYERNFQHKYKISISDEQLRTAFLSMEGLSQLTQGIVRSAVSSAEYDEYLLIRQLISNANVKEIEITGYNELDENAQAKKLTKMVQAQANRFRFMSTEFNQQQVHTHCLPSDCVIITTPEQVANLNVELLATAFNIPYAEMPSRIITIDGFMKADGQTEDEDILCMVADMDLIQFRDSLDTWENFRNPDTLMTNMFHHVWGSACICGFVNAVKFKKPTVVTS